MGHDTKGDGGAVGWKEEELPEHCWHDSSNQRLAPFLANDIFSTENANDDVRTIWAH